MLDAGGIRSRGKYSGPRRRACFSEDSWRAERTPLHIPSVLGSPLSSAPHPHSTVGSERNGGGVVGSQEELQKGPMRISCSYEGQLGESGVGGGSGGGGGAAEPEQQMIRTM